MSESQTAPRSQPQSSSSSAWKDAVEEACEKGIGAIEEPGGSIRDQDAIDFCNKYGFCSYKNIQETLKM
ncbi:BnaA04g20480D [Brassica napus]|uniref:(rape) hypothetical protein n=1 Tax=Brassica napus TaxID=3708 RepID=A0A078I3F6_BRANA|nr:unnamed protein product [Brassica napus]CDY43643.1 BnaA04g20480D [Brassica napus]